VNLVTEYPHFLETKEVFFEGDLGTCQRVHGWALVADDQHTGGDLHQQRGA
jgi:hypothetical protein